MSEYDILWALSIADEYDFKIKHEDHVSDGICCMEYILVKEGNEVFRTEKARELRVFILGWIRNERCESSNYNGINKPMRSVSINNSIYYDNMQEI